MSKTKFRSAFDFSKISKEIYEWFPGHMKKGLTKIYEQLPNVDAVIEVHDARVPLSGRNLHFRQAIIGNKPYAFVLNKADLADLTKKEKIIEKLDKDGFSPCFFTNLKKNNDKSLKSLLPAIIKQIDSQFRYNRELETNFHLLVIGVPNVGKSTLINRLRNVHLKQANAVKTGAEPGITRAVQSKVKINQNPLVYVYDTPGVLEPTFKDVEIGFKLACLNCVKNHHVNSDLLADYLLFKLNKSGNFKYVDMYGLSEPSDEILDVLIHVCKTHKKFKNMRGYDNQMMKIYDIELGAQMMIKHFFDGALGPTMLDDTILDEINENDSLDLDQFV